MPEPESLCPAQISFNLRRSVEASQTSLMLQRLRSRVLYCTNQRQRLSLSQKEKNYQIKMKMMMRVKGWVCFRFELTELTWGKFHIFFPGPLTIGRKTRPRHKEAEKDLARVAALRQRRSTVRASVRHSAQLKTKRNQ